MLVRATTAWSIRIAGALLVVCGQGPLWVEAASPVIAADAAPAIDRGAAGGTADRAVLVAATAAPCGRALAGPGPASTPAPRPILSLGGPWSQRCRLVELLC